MKIKVGTDFVGKDCQTFFIADIAANHDGDLERAKKLIHLAKKAGANAAKFQNFRANKIVSDVGFKALENQLSHQKKWQKSVFEVYEQASLPMSWTKALKEECDRCDINYFSAPYDLEAIDLLEEYVVAYKIGSGDIDWIESIQKMAKKKKPIFLATGASSLLDVKRAVNAILPIHPELVLMQCNTNYTASLENFNHIHLNVLTTYGELFPQAILGLSDHTPGHSTVLGAVALGARVIEKHFTDDTGREGPDHAFSMDPNTWQEMVSRTRELEKALGVKEKKIAENEQETCIIQRRCLRAAKSIKAGETITREMIDVLRPVAKHALLPHEMHLILGATAKKDISYGKELTANDFA